MPARITRVLVFALTAAVALTVSDAAFARHKKHRVRAHAPPARVHAQPPIARDYDGTPIIMQGFRRTRPAQERPKEHADRPVEIPRGSSTYVPPPNPSPSSANSPPAAALLQTPQSAPKLPPLNSYSDRVTNCIHSFPLQGGIGNNPSNQQAYVRQCAN